MVFGCPPDATVLWFVIAKLSQAPAPAGLSLALFPNYPATRPDRPDPTRPDPTWPDRKSKFLGNRSTCTVFFWFIWNQRCYNNGRPLILKLVPNHEEWDDKLAWFSWKWQRKSMLKWNVTVLCFLYKLIRAHKLGLSCAQLSRSCSRTFLPSSVYLQLQLDWD